MLSTVFDVFRLRQYFDVITTSRDWIDGIREDAGLLRDVRRAVITLPFETWRQVEAHPFPSPELYSLPWLEGRRLALLATGGSGALASVVGAARALEEADIRPAVISLCSGSALFGFPIAAGFPAEDVAQFVLAFQPEDYVDVDWARLAKLVPTVGRGFAGLIKGERIEATYRRLVGDMTLSEMPVPAYAPIWNVEENRLEYVGPRTHPDLAVARAIHLAVALPLFVAPVQVDGGYWCDGGLVDIFPVSPVLDIEEPCDAALAINGFYPPGFVGEDATGWQDEPASILRIASQVRTCQQAELARVNLHRLDDATELLMIEPVPYRKVQGVGFYRQFLNPVEWPSFMQAGRIEARRVLSARDSERTRTPQSSAEAHGDESANGLKRGSGDRRSDPVPPGTDRSLPDGPVDG